MTKGDGPEFVVRHDYPILFLGSWFFFLLGGLLLVIGVVHLAAPNYPKGAPVAGFGFALLGVGAVLRWIGAAWAETFTLDAEAITWQRGGAVRLRLTLAEVRHVRFGDGVLLVEGAGGGDVVRVPVHYAGFDSFFEGLKSSARSPWVSLVGAAPAQVTTALVAPPREVAPLPLVHNRWGSVVLLVAAWLGPGALALGMWLVPSFLAPTDVVPGVRNEARQQRELAKYGLSFLSLAAFVGLFFTRAEFRIDEEGVEDRYLLRSRRYGWAELLSVTVNTQRPYFDGALVVTPKQGPQIVVPLGQASYLYCDTALAAAARGGYSLATGGVPALPGEASPSAPAEQGRSDGIQSPPRNPPSRQGVQEEKPPTA